MVPRLLSQHDFFRRVWRCVGAVAAGGWRTGGRCRWSVAGWLAAGALAAGAGAGFGCGGAHGLATRPHLHRIYLLQYLVQEDPRLPPGYQPWGGKSVSIRVGVNIKRL